MGFLLSILTLAFVGLVIGDDDDEASVSTEPSPGGDEITGTASDDTISSGEGDDILTGAAGDDTLDGAQGDDIVVGDGGLDSIRGGDGNDLLVGRGGADNISGNAGDDWVEGDGGDDIVLGGQGLDTVIGGEGEDTIIGGNNDDVLIDGVLTGTPLEVDVLEQLRAGTNLEDILGTDIITLVDDEDPDLLNGNNGDDAIVFGAGDLVFGEGGTDSFAVIAGGTNEEIGPARISDFEVGTENLAIILPEGTPEDVVVTVETLGGVGGTALVQVNGQDLVEVAGAGGALTPADILLFAGLSAEFVSPN